MQCIICKTDSPGFSWTDTHGVAQCTTCGVPYVIYHYEGEGAEQKRVEKPPELMVGNNYILVIQTYWNENHRMIPSQCSFPGGYELATMEDTRLFNEWMEQNCERLLRENNS